MIELVDRLRNLVIAWFGSSPADSAPPAKQDTGQYRPRGDTRPELTVRDMFTPTEETVPDLKLLDDSPDPAERGFNPYETTSNFRWKPGGDDR